MVKTKFYKIAALTMTLSLVINSAAFASTQSSSKTLPSKEYSCTSKLNSQDKEGTAIKLSSPNRAGDSEKGKNGQKINLSNLVVAANLTKAQVFALVNLGFTIKGEIKDLIATENITQTQKNALVKLAIHSKNGNLKNKENVLKHKLDSLVKSKTITAAQEVAIVKLATKIKGEIQGLVTSGTITQAQKDALVKLVTHSKI